MTFRNEVEQAIVTRRTIKRFKDEAVDLEEIIELLEVAKWAPNHKLTEPWRFIAFEGSGKDRFVEAFWKTERDAKGELSELSKRKGEYYRNIPLHLVVVMPEDPRQRTWDEDYGAVSAMIQNFQLAAWARGIGMVWRTNNYIYDPVFREAIGVQRGEKIVATLMIGYAEHIPEPKERTSIREKLTVINE
ncbi:MAG TPA: nitroreductase [Savagea sp.]